MTAYYNEFEPKAAAWLRELIRGGHIAPGDVDERSILDVTPDDLRPYTQCHFFAGIGVWSYALRRAGWPDDRPVWTGSCPCQPFSTAGKRGGIADERHLWPAWQWLIGECRPDVVFGEQVASKDGLGWLDLVRADLEGTGYTFGALDTCAAGFGAPHIRQRLYWVADAQRDGGRADFSGRQQEGRAVDGWPREGIGWLADHDHDGSYRTRGVATVTDSDGQDERLHRGSTGGLEHACGYRGSSGLSGSQQGQGQEGLAGVPYYASGKRSTWGDFTVILCGDGKYRRIPVEPALFPLADGFSGTRVGLLRGAGNAIVPPLAAEFVQAFMEIDAR